MPKPEYMDAKQWESIQRVAEAIERVENQQEKQLLDDMGCVLDLLASLAVGVLEPHLEDGKLRGGDVAVLLGMLAFRARESFDENQIGKHAERFIGRFYQALKSGDPSLLN